MKRLVNIAAGIAIAGALGLAAHGIGTGVANAAPPMAGTQWAPPPPAPFYGYGGYDPGPPCITGPLGFVHICA